MVVEQLGAFVLENLNVIKLLHKCPITSIYC
jgi:hypothetical protein